MNDYKPAMVAGLVLLSLRVSVRPGVCVAFAVGGDSIRESAGAANIRYSTPDIHREYVIFNTPFHELVAGAHPLLLCCCGGGEGPQYIQRIPPPCVPPILPLLFTL